MSDSTSDTPSASSPEATPEEQPERILVVTAHPDDVDFGAAGSVAVWTSSGIEVTYCIVTDGSAGAVDPQADLTTLVALREDEQRAAAKEVGVREVVFLGYPDGRLQVSLDLRRDISRVIRRVKPQRVLAQSPERNWERARVSHPDHLAAGEATLCAVYPDARNPFAFPELLAEGFEAHSVDEVWVMGSPRADRAVDITDTFERKLAALRRHDSQIGAGENLDEFLRGWTAATADRFGLPEGRLAEAFQVLNTR
jgi:LmbE family N-acetylglucosaminyl deacetylase